MKGTTAGISGSGMAQVLVTGAGGFIGRALVERLLSEGIQGRPVGSVVAVDVALGGLPDDSRLQKVCGSIVEPTTLRQALRSPVQYVFHLASVPGGAAEKNPVLGRQVNLEATMWLLDLMCEQENSPMLVFASTIAVYGASLPDRVTEQTAALPMMSYGAHKLACEVLIADAVRRGLRGCSLRLPGIVARPGEGAGLVSAFMSQVFWKLEAGEPIELPVSADGTAWWLSVGACVDNLIHAATLDTDALNERRVVQMPALWLRMQEVVQALSQAYGDDRRMLVRYAPQEKVQRLFASFPPLETPEAEALGFRHDGSVDALVKRVFEEALRF